MAVDFNLKQRLDIALHSSQKTMQAISPKHIESVIASISQLDAEQNINHELDKLHKTITGVITKISIMRTQSLHLAKNLPEEQALSIKDKYDQMLTYVNELSANINLIFCQRLENHLFPWRNQCIHFEKRRKIDADGLDLNADLHYTFNQISFSRSYERELNLESEEELKPMSN